MRFPSWSGEMQSLVAAEELNKEVSGTKERASTEVGSQGA